MKQWILWISVFALALTARGNAGVFRGNGRTPVLGSTTRIQMVEEEVVMQPLRGNWPVDDSARNLDPMRFHCTFRLRNLTDETVTVQVGFPLDGERLPVNDQPVNQSAIIARYAFVAGTADQVFPVRYVPCDGKKKFSRLFLWEMTFRPRQEITLYVHYQTDGAMGLAITTKDEKPSPHRYRHLRLLEHSIMQGHFYVTETGNSWAGEIEKAVFRIVPFEFEEYLARRGPFEITEATRARLNARLPREPSLALMLLHMPMIPEWQPPRSRWREAKDPRTGKRCLELIFAPFKPRGKEDNLQILYRFVMMPQNVEQLELLLSCIRNEMETEEQRYQRIREAVEKLPRETPGRTPKQLEPPLSYSPAVEKDIADIVLEFHGIATGNEEIREFLECQKWYPAPSRPLDPALKKRLEELSRR